MAEPNSSGEKPLAFVDSTKDSSRQSPYGTQVSVETKAQVYQPQNPQRLTLPNEQPGGIRGFLSKLFRRKSTAVASAAIGVSAMAAVAGQADSGEANHNPNLPSNPAQTQKIESVPSVKASELLVATPTQKPIIPESYGEPNPSNKESILEIKPTQEEFKKRMEATQTPPELTRPTSAEIPEPTPTLSGAPENYKEAVEQGIGAPNVQNNNSESSKSAPKP